MPKRIGIYGGSFNPVHAGHIAFALQAMQAAGLNELYFLPERRPRHKKSLEHFGHRVAMLNRAAKPYKQFKVMELPDLEFSVKRTIPRLREQLGTRSELVFLMGSDVALHLPHWPHAEQLLTENELVVGLRSGQATDEFKKELTTWPVMPKAMTVFESFAPDVSSQQVRQALRRRQPARGLLASVQRYSNQHWLYVSLA